VRQELTLVLELALALALALALFSVKLPFEMSHRHAFVNRCHYCYYWYVF
jgi:hypothetical protein